MRAVRRFAAGVALAAGGLGGGCFTSPINMSPIVTVQSPDEVRRGGIGSFDAEVVDPDGDGWTLSWIALGDCPPPGTVPSAPPDEWDLHPVFMVAAPLTSSPSFCVVARAVDDHGATGTGTLPVHPQNNKPIARIGPWAPTQDLSAVPLGDLVTLSGHDSSDADLVDADQLTFTWSWQTRDSLMVDFKDCPKTVEAADRALHCFFATEPGDYVAVLSVSDGIDSDTAVQKVHVLAGP
jgi:hypothetical protein